MEFTIPWQSLFGGMLLGLSASILMFFSGKVAGISGVISGLLAPNKRDSLWRIAFLAGMILSVYMIAPLGYVLPDISDNNILLVMVAGLLVGFGTRLGNGCSSGHGIIGMGRLKLRSIIATMTFMLSAALVVFFRNMMGWL